MLKSVTAFRFLVGLILGVLLLVITGFILPAWSQDAEKDVFIGINTPLSGPYERMGQDQLRGFELAIERLNEEGGVLGQEIEYEARDSQAHPAVAKENSLEFVQEYGANMISGGISTDVALAQSEVAQEHEVPFFAGITHSTEPTGFKQVEEGYGEQKANRYTFRWFFNAWMTQEALIPHLIERFEPGQRLFYITADYAWGHSLEHAFQHGTEAAGFDTAGSVRTPFGTEDYSEAVEEAKAVEPDILVLTQTGRDLLHALRQVHRSGLDQDLPVVVPATGLNLARSLGPDIMQNVISTTVWYWELEDRYPGSEDFVQAYREEYGEPPEVTAATGWVAVKEWAEAVERAETLDSREVIRELEGHEFQLLKDSERWRSWDHQAVSSVYIIEGKSENEMQGEWDVFSIREELPGEEVMRSREENPVMFEPLE